MTLTAMRPDSGFVEGREVAVRLQPGDECHEMALPVAGDSRPGMTGACERRPCLSAWRRPSPCRPASLVRLRHRLDDDSRGRHQGVYGTDFVWQFWVVGFGKIPESRINGLNAP